MLVILTMIRDAPKVAVAFFDCAKNFLCNYGLNHLSQVSRLHHAVHSFVKSNIFQHQSFDLKVAMVHLYKLATKPHL